MFLLNSLQFGEAQHSTAVSPILQLTATLSLLASGSFQHCVGFDFLNCMAQSTISTIVQRVCKQIEAKVCCEEIKFREEHFEECKGYFMRKFNIPGGKEFVIISILDNSIYNLFFSYWMYRRHSFWASKTGYK